MRASIIAVLAVLFLTTAVFADNTLISVSEDSWIPRANSTNNDNIPFGCPSGYNSVANTSYNYGNCTVNVGKYMGSPDVSFDSLLKFNISAMKRKIIYAVYLHTYNNGYTNGGVPTTGIFFKYPIGYTADNSFNELSSIAANYVRQIGFIGVACMDNENGIANGNGKSTNMGANYGFLTAFYNASTDSFTLGSDEATAGYCGGTQTAEYFASREAGTPAKLNITWSDYVTGKIEGTDVTNVYFDFENQSVSTTLLVGADFRYDVANNVFYPLSSANIYNYAPFMTTGTNTLAATACGGNPGYSTDPLYNLNIPAPEYDTICFNLSYHNVPMYAAIKILNNTNVRNGALSNPEFDFYYALFSADYTVLGVPIFDPPNPQGSRNVTITWASSQPMTTEFHYQAIDPVNGLQAWQTIVNTTPTAYHSVTVSDFIGGDTYNYYVQGTVGGSTFTSANYSIYISVYQTAFTDITSGIAILVQNEYGDGMSGFCSIDGSPMIPTTPVAAERVCYFDGFGLGNHTFIVTANGYRTKNLTLQVTTDPFSYATRLTPTTTCVRGVEASTQAQCESNIKSFISTVIGQNGINATSWYCEFKAGACNVFDTNGNPICGLTINGTTVNPPEGGLWQGYYCLDGFVTEGKPINASIPRGSTGNNTGTSTVTSGAGEFLGSLFGVSSASAIAGLVLILLAVIMSILAVKARSEVSGVGALICFLVGFFFLGFIPVWVVLVLVLIAAGAGAVLGSKVANAGG